MSVDEMMWLAWLDDMDRITNSTKGAIEALESNPSDSEGISNLKVELHSAKGLLDSAGFVQSAFTFYELEEAFYKGEGSVDSDMLEMVAKGLEKLYQLIKIVRERNPKSGELDEIDEQLGMPSILVKFNRKYNVRVVIGSEASLKSARAIGIVNSVKGYCKIISSSPSLEDLYEDVKFEDLTLELESKEGQETIKEKIAGLIDVTEVSVDTVTKSKKGDSGDQYSDLSIRLPIRYIRQLEGDLSILSRHAEALRSIVSSPAGIEELNGVFLSIQRIQDDVRKMRKVPLDTITSNLSGMIKRLAKQEGKQAELFLQGRFTSLDRSLANHLIDPITQIIRNAISHGIEKSNVRMKAGKPMSGRITITATNERDKIFIKIADDGAGINVDDLITKAKKEKIINQSPTSRNESINLIFSKGFSTSEGSSISGRGVGLYAAKQKIEEVGGTLVVTSEKGKGTEFTIEITDSDALTKNLLFRINSGTYAIPTSEIEEVLILENSEFKKEEKIFKYQENNIPMINLQELLYEIGKGNGNGNNGNGENKQGIMLICRGKNSAIGLMIDSILEERLVNIRPLNSILRNFKLFNGTILGRDREIIMVLNPNEIN